MVRDTYDAVLSGQDVRKNLSKLKQEIRDTDNRHALLYYMGNNRDSLLPFLLSEDPKVRKNAAAVLGGLSCREYLDPLYEAYEKETTLFVKSAYLKALKEFDFRKYIPSLKERLSGLEKLLLASGNMEELKEDGTTVSNKKHLQDEVRQLTDLILMAEGTKKHRFNGEKIPSEIVLLTNRNHITTIQKQLQDIAGIKNLKAFNAGLLALTEDLDALMQVRTFPELLYFVPGMKSCEPDPKAAALVIAQSGLLSFLEKRHSGNGPFYFRLEIKSKLPLDKKSAFAKALAAEIEKQTQYSLKNSTSDYELEIRLIANSTGRYNLMVKLFTWKDRRFEYRKEAVASSIRPVNAALTMAVAGDYLKENAKILDPFCGVGTMLIERHKYRPANTMYGIDIYNEGIEKAKINTQAARQIIHYINKDFFEFTHKYLFDEIITNMPMTSKSQGRDELRKLYRHFFQKAPQHLEEDGILVLYTHDLSFVLEEAGTGGFVIKKKWEISKVEGTYVVILAKEKR